MIHARILLLITTAAATIATRLIMVVRIPTPIIMLVLVYLTQLIITSGMPMPSSSIKISSPASSSSSSSSLLRIIAGTEADELRYPYVVSISQYPDAPNFCGGSFIAPDVVLSAAHCNCALYHGNSSTCQIAVGRNNISTPFYGDDDGETIFYEKEIIHPNFNPASLLPESSVIPDYDFNLIFLNDTISENSTVASNYMTYIQINDNAAIPQSGEELTIVGWGDTIQDIYLNATSTVLMEATEFVVTNTVCEQSKGYVQNLIYESYEGKITDNMLCSQKDGTGACQVSCFDIMLISSHYYLYSDSFAILRIVLIRVTLVDHSSRKEVTKVGRTMYWLASYHGDTGVESKIFLEVRHPTMNYSICDKSRWETNNPTDFPTPNHFNNSIVCMM